MRPLRQINAQRPNVPFHHHLLVIHAMYESSLVDLHDVLP